MCDAVGELKQIEHCDHAKTQEHQAWFLLDYGIARNCREDSKEPALNSEREIVKLIDDSLQELQLLPEVFLGFGLHIGLCDTQRSG